MLDGVTQNAQFKGILDMESIPEYGWEYYEIFAIPKLWIKIQV